MEWQAQSIKGIWRWGYCWLGTCRLNLQSEAPGRISAGCSRVEERRWPGAREKLRA